MLCQPRHKIMPHGDSCQGLVANFSMSFIIEKTIVYKMKCSKCFKFLMKKMALTLKNKSTTSCARALKQKDALLTAKRSEKTLSQSLEMAFSDLIYAIRH